MSTSDQLARSARQVVSRLLAVILLAVVLSTACRRTVGPGVDPAPTPRFAPAVCPTHELEVPVRCGTVEVFEDRAAATGRTIDLQVIVLGATGGVAAGDPVFVLLGGPGQGAAELALRVAPDWSEIRRRRDVIFVDQRGTGGSNPLDCRLPDDLEVVFSSVFPQETLRRCREDLESRADLTLYTTAHFADDLDDVRRALGYDRINLAAGSYGTRAALVYLRRHRSRVRSLVLDGVLPTHQRAVVTYARTADESLRLLFADCRSDPDCARSHPDLERRFERFWESYREPAEVEIETADGTAVVSVPKGVFAYGIRGMQYGSAIWRLPKALAAATAGDLGPVAEAYWQRARAVWEAVSMGLHLSVLCSEDLPFVEATEVVRLTDGTYLGRTLFDEYRRVCEKWVRGDTELEEVRPVAADVPALLFSGRRDPTTPPWLAERLIESLPAAEHVVFPLGGHGYPGGDDGGCKARLTAAFLEGGTAAGLDTSCAETVRPKGFAL